MNTSQDPDYEGPTGFEKRIHKTHFSGADRKFRESLDWENVWVEVGRGKYRLQKKARMRDEQSEVNDG